MKDPDATGKSIDILIAGSLIKQAQIEVLLALVSELAKRSGLEQIEGLSIYDWFHEKKKQRVSEILISLEDSSPAVAAYLQKQIDDAEGRIRDKGGEV